MLEEERDSPIVVHLCEGKFQKERMLSCKMSSRIHWSVCLIDIHPSLKLNPANKPDDVVSLRLRVFTQNSLNFFNIFATVLFI